jgi:hypothetical protein
MLGAKLKYAYNAFGLNILSDISLPELLPIINHDCKADIEIQIEEIRHLWSDDLVDPNGFIVREEFVMFQVSKLGMFSIQDGNKIKVSPKNNADLDEIKLYILGTCMGALLMQRKVLPLHGSAVVIDDRVFAFVGESGAGKSTLAKAFIDKGYDLVTDDVIAVTFLPGGEIPVVLPSYPQQKLWQESLDEFGMNKSDYQPLFERETKYAIPVQTKFMNKPLPLGGVFELVKSESKRATFGMDKLERIHTLFLHTYRHFLVQKLGLMEWHFDMTTKLASKVDLFRLIRANNDGFTAHKLVSQILSTINKEN